MPPRRTADRDGAADKRFLSTEVPLYFQLAAVLREQILSGR